MSDFDFVRTKIGDCEVTSGAGAIEELVPAVRERAEGGAVALIYDGGGESERAAIRKRLGAEFNVYEQAAAQPTAGVPEHVRHVVALGGGEAAEAAKEVGCMLRTSWTAVPTSPDCYDVMRSTPPTFAILDGDMLQNCTCAQIASAYGALAAQPLADFEDFFAQKVLAENVQPRLALRSDDLDPLKLATETLKLSASKRRDDSADLISKVLRAQKSEKGEPVRLHGEYKFVAAALLTAFYSAYLGSPSIDVMLPPRYDDDIEAERLKVSGRKTADFFDIDGYFRIGYILGEYRTDLLDRLSVADFRKSQRQWRRLYPDAGYWLKSQLSIDELLCAMRIAGALSDSLLGYAYASGVLTFKQSA